MIELTLIDKKQVASIIENDPVFVKQAVMRALVAHYKKQFIPIPKQRILKSNDLQDKILSMPAYIYGGKEDVSGMKWLGSHPENIRHGLSRSNGLIILNCPKTNAPMAILSGELISSMRTFSISLIAMDLFKPHPKTVGVIGMGKLGRMHVKHLMNLYPSIETFYCYSETAKYDDLLSDPRIKACQDPAQVIQSAEVVINCTNAKAPYLDIDTVQADQLIVALSSRDYTPAVYATADAVVIDDWKACTHPGR